MKEITEVLTVDSPAAPRATTWQPVMRSPINGIHRHQGAHLSIDDGWEIPLRYEDPELERATIQERVGIADITARGKIDVRGSVDAALANLPQTRGATLARISRNWALVLTPAARLSQTVELFERSSGAAMVTDATSIYAGIALVGARVDELLLRLVAIDPSTLGPGDAVATQALRVPAVLLRRDLGTNVVEMYVGAEFARYAWQALVELAQPLGAAPVGVDSLTATGWR